MSSMKKGDAWFLIFSVVFVLVSFYQNKHKLPHMIKSIKEWNKKEVYERKVQSKKKTQTKQSETTEVYLPVKTETTETTEPTEEKQHWVYLYGLMDYNEEDLHTIRRGIEDYYGFRVSIASSINQLSEQYYLENRGLNAHKIVSDLQLGTEGFHMLVTNEALLSNKEKPDFISGYGLYYRRYSIVTTHQLKMNGNYAVSNLQNVANHEIGHNFGLRHCEAVPCLMNETGTDVTAMCDQCKRGIPNW